MMAHTLRRVMTRRAMKCTFCAVFHRDVAQITLRIAVAIRAAMAVGGGDLRGRQHCRVTA